MSTFERGFAIRTLLMTDVVGSTRLWAAHPYAMPELLRCLEDQARQAVGDQGGTVVKARGEGDSLFCVLPHPAAALRAAQALFGALDAEPCDGVQLKLRAAVHCGPAVERDADIYGPVPNRCARLREIGHGGQILLSDAARAQIAASDDLRLLDLGRHRLRDLDEPERVWQLGEQRFPPLRSLTSLRNNLPTQFTSFIGRDALRAELVERLKVDRLTTLTGAGGCGKTRLALQLGADAIDDFPDGVWFVELAETNSKSEVIRAIAEVCGHRDLPESDRVAPLIERFAASDRELLIFDNAEQAVAPIGDVAAALLNDLPSLRIVVTSREPLRLRGERIRQVPTLSVPQPGKNDPTSVAASEAASLFIDRAALRLADFALSDENSRALAEIVRRLDGIPLCIEMVASHVGFLTPAQIATRLNDRFPLLDSGERDVPARHRTMREAISWQIDTLDPEEVRLLQRLAVFAGGFTLDGAEVVGGSPSSSADGVLRRLRGLVEKSLVVSTVSEGEMRYRLLEVIAQFASEMSSSEADAAMPSLLSWALATSEEGYRRIYGDDRDRCVVQLDGAYPSIRKALEWALAGHDLRAASLSISLTRYWMFRGLYAQGATFAKQAAQLPVEADLCGRLMNAVGVFSDRLGDRRRAEEAYRSVLDSEATDQVKAPALTNLAILLNESGQFERSLELYERAAELAARTGDPYTERLARFNMAQALFDLRRTDDAEVLIGRVLQSFASSGDRTRVALCHGLLASEHANRQDAPRVAWHLLAALDGAGDFPDSQFMADLLLDAAWLAAHADNDHLAALLLGGHEARQVETGAKMAVRNGPKLQSIVASIGSLPEGQRNSAQAYGRTASLESLIAASKKAISLTSPGDVHTSSPIDA